MDIVNIDIDNIIDRVRSAIDNNIEPVRSAYGFTLSEYYFDFLYRRMMNQDFCLNILVNGTYLPTTFCSPAKMPTKQTVKTALL